MEPNLDLVASDIPDSGLIGTPGDPAHVDVPGMLAGRIGDLYASEESRQRKERAKRMIERAEGLD